MFANNLPNFNFVDNPSSPSPPSSSSGSSTTKISNLNLINNNLGSATDQELDKTKLIVNYIPQFATEMDLAEVFSVIGELESIKIMRDYKTGYSFGFGFVKYCNPNDAATAIKEINGMIFKNKRLKVSYSRPAGVEMKDSNLYISNLPRDANEHFVFNLFSPFGEIVQTTVLKDKITGMPRGVAFVRYAKGEQAQAAIAQLHGKLLDNALYPLSVRVAEDHGRQKAQYLQNRVTSPFRGGQLQQPPLQFRNYINRNFNNNYRNLAAGDNSQYYD